MFVHVWSNSIDKTDVTRVEQQSFNHEVVHPLCKNDEIEYQFMYEVDKLEA